MFILQAFLLAISLALLFVQAAATLGAKREMHETLSQLRAARKEADNDDDDDDDDNWWRSP